MIKRLPILLFLLIIIGFLSSCKEKNNVHYGYVDADYLYVSSNFDGKIEDLYVSKGTTVKENIKLFKIDGVSQKYDYEKSVELYNAAGNTVKDMNKGARAEKMKAWNDLVEAIKTLSEGASIGQKIVQGLRKVNAIEATKNLQVTYMFRSFTSLYKAAYDYGKYLELGDRPDKIAAAVNEQNAAKAEMDKADWDLKQITQYAPADALVYDTLYQKGEFVSKGKPVVILLPPSKIKARFYVNGEIVNKLKLGQTVKVKLTGNTEAYDAKIIYIAPDADYTEPYLYTLENNNKYVYMVDAEFSKLTNSIHPGQPIEVTFN
ncbi:MAG TPA: HlyD family efflux transporter periplasmic adaptor subunit [Victivallales bacterium]|nr:HlyD family efflux transporter periplasmic adaptor subunit [Victivallales bacterium]